MAGQLTTTELARLISEEGPFSPGSEIEGEQMIGTITELLRHNAHPDYLTVMASESVTQEYPGPEEFEGAWNDWMSPYEGFRVEFEEVFQLEDKVVFLVRQIGTTRHSGVVVETPSASVWWLEDAQIRQAAFYLDRRAGLRAAGIDPDRPEVT
jgi:ketosteroid isomerase-like protein